MWNIEFKGKLKGSIDQISTGKELPEGCVQFQEPDKVEKAMLQGMLFVVPGALVMIALAIFRIVTTYSKPENLSGGQYVKSFLPALIVALLLAYPAMYVHEFIHAFLFPEKLKKQIYVHPESMTLFVYCEEMVSKVRFVVISLGPAFGLGIFPFLLGLIFARFIPAQIMVALTLFSVISFMGALGDFVNAWNCVRQVPKDGKVFNRGFHSYWIR